MAGPEQQIQFLSNIQRVLDEGQFTSTYKYALLLAIANIRVEEGDRVAEMVLEISIDRIAEEFVRQYWRQTVPYVHCTADVGVTLLQNPKQQAEIITRIKRERERHGELLLPLLHNRAARDRIVRDVARVDAEMPLEKLQNVGGGKVIFLYADANLATSITLLPGVCYCIRTHHTLIRSLVRGAGLQRVRRLNGGVLGEKSDLHDFMFGGERTVLSSVQPSLRDLQEDMYFYCREPLPGKNVAVDHFIPWSRYPVDLGHNFVLAHATCNSNKSNLRAASIHLEHWVNQVQRYQNELEHAFSELRISMNLGRPARIANWAYSRDHERQAMTWRRAKELETLPAGWAELLAGLLN